MTNYIIDPAVFYWINVLSIIQTVCAVIGGFTLTGFVTLFVVYAIKRYGLSEPDKPDEDDSYEMKIYERYLKDYEDERNNLQRIRKYMMTALIVGGLLVVLSIFIPGKQTSVEMLVAKTATFDNVNWTVQQVKEIIDYIVNALKGAM